MNIKDQKEEREKSNQSISIRTPIKDKQKQSSMSGRKTTEMVNGLFENKENIGFNQLINVSQFSSCEKNRKPLTDITDHFRSESTCLRKNE